MYMRYEYPGYFRETERHGQRKTKGLQLKAKIVSEFHTFSELFPQDFPLQNKGF